MQQTSKTLATSRGVGLCNKLSRKKIYINCAQINVVDCSDVIMFMSLVSLALRKVVQLVEPLISGHPQDLKKGE